MKIRLSWSNTPLALTDHRELVVSLSASRCLKRVGSKSTTDLMSVNSAFVSGMVTA